MIRFEQKLEAVIREAQGPGCPPRLGEAINLGVEFEPLKDVAHGGRESLQVSAEVFADVILVAHELLQVERRGVVEKLTGLAQQEGLGIQAGSLAGFLLGKDGSLGRFQYAIQAAQDDEGEDDLTVLVTLISATKQFEGAPDGRGHAGRSYGR